MNEALESKLEERVVRRFKPYPEYRDSGVKWLGEIPIHWELKGLKRLASLRAGVAITAESIEEAGQYPVFGGNGVRGFTSSYTHDGDFPLIGRQGALCGCVNFASGRFWASEHAVVAAPSAEVHPRWLAYLLGGMSLNSYSVAAAQPGLAVDTISALHVPAPSNSEQFAIADFLDRETAKIDALVEKKKRLIDLLQEKRTALITQAVTKGLDPSVPMRDSGVEWPGQIPEAWVVRKNKVLFSEIDDRSVFGEEELLTVSHITGVTPRSEKEVYMFEAESHEGYKLCSAGDLVINTMWAWMGALGIAHQDGMVSPSYNVYRITDMGLLPDYLDYLCRIPAYVTELTRYSKGVWKSRLRLYPDEFMQIMTVVPPLEEQHAIVGYLRRETTRIEALIAKVKSAIERLGEYRTALISAAVTGKIDVRHAA